MASDASPQERTYVPTRAHPGDVAGGKDRAEVDLDPDFLAPLVHLIAPGVPPWARLPLVACHPGEAPRSNYLLGLVAEKKLASLAFDHRGQRYLILFDSYHKGADYIAIGNIIRGVCLRAVWAKHTPYVGCADAGVNVLTCHVGLLSWGGV